MTELGDRPIHLRLVASCQDDETLTHCRDHQEACRLDENQLVLGCDDADNHDDGFYQALQDIQADIAQSLISTMIEDLRSMMNKLACSLKHRTSDNFEVIASESR